MNDKISIIVPVYNVVDYLDRCLKSLVTQTYTNLEIIVVDDGSNDGSEIKCDLWAEKDTRIKVVHKENGGLSDARNKGLECVTGRYVGFVDSDDWVENEMYQELYMMIKKYKVDYAVIEAVISKRVEKISNTSHEIKLLNKNDMLLDFFRVTTQDIHYFAWNKLYDFEKIKDVRFIKGIRFEDIDYNFRVIEQCETAVMSSKKMYHWFYNEKSITRNSLKKADLQLMRVWKNIANDCKNKNHDYYGYARNNYERAYFGVLAKYLKYGVDINYREWNEDRKKILRHLKKKYRMLIKWNMPNNRKIILTLICMCPNCIFDKVELIRKKIFI